MKMDFNRIQQIVNETVYKYGKMQVNESFMGEDNNEPINGAEPVDRKVALEIANDVVKRLREGNIEGLENIKIGNKLTTITQGTVDEIVLYVQIPFDVNITVGSDIEAIQKLSSFIRSSFGEDVRIHTGQGADKAIIDFEYKYSNEDGEKIAKVVLHVTNDSTFSELHGRKSTTENLGDLNDILLDKITDVSSDYMDEIIKGSEGVETFDDGTPRTRLAYILDDALYKVKKLRKGKNKPGSRHDNYLNMDFPRFDNTIERIPVMADKSIGGENGVKFQKPISATAAIKLILGDKASLSTINSVENLIKFILSDNYRFAHNQKLLDGIKNAVIHHYTRDYKDDGMEFSPEMQENMRIVHEFEALWNKYSKLGNEESPVISEMKNLWGRMLLY